MSFISEKKEGALLNTVGIVTEYNPFHNGHLYQLNEAKKRTGCDYSVAVMSGNFVQRGEPALFDKFTRARLAVECGVDLVLEIPPASAIASAEYFAQGSIAVLEATGIVDTLCFGSETGNLRQLKQLARHLLAPETQEKIRLEMQEGIPVYQAMQKVLPDYPSSPNDILGIEYLKALERQKSRIKPYAVQRIGTGYHERKASGSIASATAIRELLAKGEEADSLLPYDHLPCEAASEKELETALLYALRIKTPEQLKRYADVSEGLENRIYEVCRKYDSIEEIILAVKSKRYSYTRIRRILYNIFLDIPREMRERKPEFIRVLGFNRKGQALLNRMRETAKLPVINGYAKRDFARYETAQLDKKENDLYALSLPERKVFEGGLRAIIVPEKPFCHTKE